MVVAGFLAVAGGILVEPPANAAATTSIGDLKARAIYFQQVRKMEQRDLAVGSIAAASASTGKLWADFLNTWASTSNQLKINSAVPAGLPTKGHVFVVLGSALSKSGKLTAKLERRLKISLKALAKYPKSHVLVSGGGKKNGKTEGQVMRKWLIAKGIKSTRILVETKSASTIGNAKYSIAMLSASPKYTSYTLISDSSHIRRASVLFAAATILVQEQRGTTWSIKPVSNIAFMDLATAGKKPLSASSVAYTASNVASLLGVLPQLKKLIASPPSSAVLTSVKVTAPSQLTYAVGSALNTKGLLVTAVYDKGVYARVVTGRAEVTGFDSTKVGDGVATATYTEGAVRKTASFGYTIVKATAKVGLSLSTKSIKRAKTKVAVTTKLTAGALVPTGKVRFYLDGKLVKTVNVGSNGAVAKVTYPRITTVGKHEIVVKYSGDAQLKSTSKALRISVVA